MQRENIIFRKVPSHPSPVDAAHVNGAIGGTALIVDLVEGQRLDVLCGAKKWGIYVHECVTHYMCA